jgi:UDP-glucose 4-epimerase
VILRYFSVYGPRQRPDIAFSTFCGAAVRDEPVAVFGDGRQTRDFTYVDDVVAATRAAAAADGVSGGVYNVGGSWRISLADALELIGELAARPLRGRPSRGPGGRRSGHRRRLVGSAAWSRTTSGSSVPRHVSAAVREHGTAAIRLPWSLSRWVALLARAVVKRVSSARRLCSVRRGTASLDRL